MSLRFERLGTITVEPGSWSDKVFLTFDIDWASDEVLADAIDLVEQAGVPATWFATHDTPLLRRLRVNPNFEVGIHPNFNRLLFNESAENGRTANEVLARLLSAVPGAKCVRSHSVTQSSQLLGLFGQSGLTHHCNTFIPADSGLRLRPWRLWNGMTEVPYGWADDAQFVYGWKPQPLSLSHAESLIVYAFHPIHVVLNSTDAGAYDRNRDALGDYARLRRQRCAGFGVRSQLEQLLSAAP